jgi:ubiquinone biosynthesis protein Coq4
MASRREGSIPFSALQGLHLKGAAVDRSDVIRLASDGWISHDVLHALCHPHLGICGVIDIQALCWVQMSAQNEQRS